MRRILKTALRVIVITLLVTTAWGGWYIYHRGFTRQWRQYVNSEFEKHGLSVSISRLTLDPFHGLIARDVKIYDVKGRPLPVAVISQVVLDIDYSQLIHHKPFLNGVDLRDTKLTLPVNPADPASPDIVISNLNARVLIDGRIFDLSKADANIYGIHVTMKGNVANLEDLHLSGAGNGSRNADISWVKDLIHRIAALKFEAATPQLDIEFNGDARDPKSILVEASLHGERIQSGNYMLENLDTVASYQNGVLNLKKCVAREAGDAGAGTPEAGGGTLDVSGKWDPVTGFADIQLRSTLDIQRFSHAFNLASELDDFVFKTPPDIEISAERNAQNAPRFTLTGHIELGGFSFKSVDFDGFNANFSWDGTRWFARDIQLTHPTGVLKAKIMQLPGDFRADIESTLNPNFLRQILSGKAAEALSQFDFIDPPYVKLAVRGPSPDLDQCITTGTLQLGHASLRHSLMDKAQCSLLIKDRAITYQQFTIQRGDGAATGSFTYDFAKHEIRLDKIKSSLMPADVAPWLDNPDIPKYVAPYRFNDHPNFFINGVVQFSGGKNTNLEILVDAPNGMDYTFIKKNLSASSISGRLLFTDGHLQLSNVNAAIFGGRVQGGADISLAPGSPGYSANIQAKNIDFQKLTKLYFDYDNSRGQLNGAYTFTGRGDDPRAMDGSGQATVTNGNVFAIPFLGPFTAIMNSFVPGLGYDVARKATATFRVSGGVIDVPAKNFLVQGRGFNMLGGGKIHFLDDNMNFDIRINAQGLVGELVTPVSKLFEYTSQGSLSKPVWHPKHLPNL